MRIVLRSLRHIPRHHRCHMLVQNLFLNLFVQRYIHHRRDSPKISDSIQACRPDGTLFHKSQGPQSYSLRRISKESLQKYGRLWRDMEEGILPLDACVDNCHFKVICVVPGWHWMICADLNVLGKFKSGHGIC